MSGKNNGVNKALLTFISENAKAQEVNEKESHLHKHTLTQAQYLEAAKQQGIPEDTLKALHDFRVDLTSATVHFLTDKLSHHVKESKKAGNDPSDLTEELKIPTHDGSTTISIRARQEYQIPSHMRKEGSPDTSVKHGVITIKEKTTRTLDKEVAEHASEVIGKLFG